MAYEAESTLDAVLARVPDSVFEHDTEVLVIDDSSEDRTFDVGVRSARESRHRITVLYNPQNQGYGGNQKLGYQYAIRHGFDFVVLLHGDGQYAPEAIPMLLAPLLRRFGRCGAGLAHARARAWRGKGGMPLYKLVGNKVLTFLQNRLLGSDLSEFHSGFRAYSVAALRRIPFGFNSNVFHFDTEIIIQLMLAGCRIIEVPIPTYYGDEICRVDGIRYAKDVVAATIASRLHRLNIFYDRRFDIAGDTNTPLRPQARVPLVAHRRARRPCPQAPVSSTSAAAPAPSTRISRRRAVASPGWTSSRPPRRSAFERFMLVGRA